MIVGELGPADAWVFSRVSRESRETVLSSGLWNLHSFLKALVRDPVAFREVLRETGTVITGDAVQCFFERRVVGPSHAVLFVPAEHQDRVLEFLCTSGGFPDVYWATPESVLLAERGWSAEKHRIPGDCVKYCMGRGFVDIDVVPCTCGQTLLESAVRSLRSRARSVLVTADAAVHLFPRSMQAEYREVSGAGLGSSSGFEEPWWVLRFDEHGRLSASRTSEETTRSVRRSLLGCSTYESLGYYLRPTRRFLSRPTL